MIIECPSCSKRYRIADDAVPREGRTVRCAACKTSWFQEAVAAPPEPPAAPAPTPQQPVPEPPPPAVEPPPAPPVRTPPIPTRSPAPSSGIAGNLLLGVLSLALLFVVLALAPGGFCGIDLGRRFAPDTPGSALVLSLHEPIWGKVLDGRSVLTIAGKLENPAPVTLAAPALDAEVRDADGTLLAKWLTPPPVAELAPGASVTFDTAAIAVPPSARTVTIRFETRRK